MLRVGCALVIIAVVGCGGGSTPGKDAAGPKGDGSDVADRGVDKPGEDHAEVGADVAADAPGEDAAMDGAGDTAQEVGGSVDAGAGDADASVADTGDGAAEVAEPKTAAVSFTGTVVTVAPQDGGMPLGFDTSVRTKPVSGTFSYNLGYADDTPATDRGTFERLGKMAFKFLIEGHTITGSGKGQLQTENLATSDTFRYQDGKFDNGTRIMKFDGVDAPKLVLFIAITDSTGTMLTSDALPAPFPTIDIKTKPHTFKLADEGGTLLMQLDTLVSQP